MYANRLILGILLAIATLPVRAESLLEIYLQAQIHDPKFKIADAERQIPLQQRRQVQAQLLPNVTLGANITQQEGSGMARDGNSSGYTLSLNHPLYKREAQLQLQQSDLHIQKAEIIYLGAQQDLILRVAQLYFAILAAKDNLSFAHSNKNAIQRQLEQSRQRFEVGLIAITDVQESQARYDLAQAEEIGAENNLRTAREALREVTGYYYETLADLNENISLPEPQPAHIEAWIDAALDHNSTLHSARLSADIAAHEIQRQRAGHYPNVNLIGQHSYNDAPGSSYSRNSSIGINVSVPLYLGGAVEARISEAGLRRQQALDTIDLHSRNVERQTREAYLNVLSSISRVKALQQAVRSSQTAYEATQTGFNVGTRTSVDVLNSQRDLLSAQRDYASTRYQYVLNTLLLKYASGALQLSDLEALEQWFQ
jgi:outer membrane protein